MTNCLTIRITERGGVASQMMLPIGHERRECAGLRGSSTGEVSEWRSADEIAGTGRVCPGDGISEVAPGIWTGVISGVLL